MILKHKILAIAVLTLVLGCSDSNASNSVIEEASQVNTESQNPIKVENTKTDNSQTNSSQNQIVAVEKKKINNQLQKQPLEVENTEKTNKSQKQSVATEKNQSDAVNDTFIIPGKRIGLITAKTTRADLVEIYGETNLKDDVILRGEGTISFPVTKINSTTPGALTIFWTDESRNKISHISGIGRQWKTLDGLGIGTSIDGLSDVLGKFKLTGFAWDNGGFVYLEGTNLSKDKNTLGLRLAPDTNLITKYQKQFSAVSGDSIFSSTNPNLKPLDVRISQMIVTFDRNISPDMY